MTLTDVFCTGHHAAVTAQVGPGVSVAVVGDGAVGLCAVLAARRMGAEQIVLMGWHTDRTDLGAGFGATDIVLSAGEEAVEEVRKLTRGHGVDAALECVGSMQTLTTSFGAVRDGGIISRVGVPSYTDGPIGIDMIMRNITLAGGVDPARHYIDGILPDVLDSRIEPVRSSTAPSGWTACPTATGPWPAASPSKSSSSLIPPGRAHLSPSAVPGGTHDHDHPPSPSGPEPGHRSWTEQLNESSGCAPLLTAVTDRLVPMACFRSTGAIR